MESTLPFRPARDLLAAVLAVAAAAAHAQAAPDADDAASAAPIEQRRCGWLATHGGDAVLSDRHGDWLIARAGTPGAGGAWRPGFAPGQSVSTADGAVGCACLTAQVDLATHRVVAATAPQAKPLAACRGDRSLDVPADVRGASAARKTLHATSFSVAYPANWRARAKADCVTLDAPRKARNEEYTLALCGKPGTLAQAADEQVIAPGDDGVWLRTAGMDGPSPVEWMFGPGWDAVVTTQTCGVGDTQTGFHAGGGTCLMFAASDGRRAVTADSVGYYQDFGQLREILRSIRFDPVSATK
jgi:hypothetical protein